MSNIESGASRNSQNSTFDCQSIHSRRTYTLNSLWSIWYCTIAISFQVYIIAHSIQRFTIYLSLPWPNGQPPFTALNSYVILIGGGVIILPFFVVVAMMKIGNYPNDGYKLGLKFKINRTYANAGNNIYQNIKIPEPDIKRRRGFHVCRLIWRHSIPTAPFLHMLAAICFLLPRILMEAQLIKHGFLGKGDIWKTEIDFILNRLEDKRISMFSFLNTINDTERSLLNMESYTLNQYLTKHSNIAKQYDYHLEESGHLSMELINFIVALFVLSVRYPSVFWRVSKSFGFLLSLQLVINLVQSLVIYSAFQILLKVIVCDPSQVLVRYNTDIRLTVFQISIAFVMYLIVLIFCGTPIYMYGLQKYREWSICQTRRVHVTVSHGKQRLWGYLPHFCAFLILTLLAVFVSPLFYDLIVIYCGSLDSTALIAIISTAVHLLLWILLWLMLTLKNKWLFTDNFECDNCSVKYNARKVEKKLMRPQSRGDPPLLVIENGKTYQIRETASKRAILGITHKSRIPHKPISPSCEDEDIYWLKPKPATPNKVLSKDSPEDENTLMWLKNDKLNATKNKVSFDDGNSTTGSKGKKKSSRKSPKNTMNKSKKNKADDNDIDFDQISNQSDGDYATLRRIVANDFQNTHLNLCPLRHETIELPKSYISPTMDGDYELLIEQPYSQNHTCNGLANKVSPIEIYTGNGSNHMTSTPITVTAHFSKDEHMVNNEELTPRSASMSETSNSPEKSSDTSSGVHSNSSDGANLTPPLSILGKRSTSMENIMQQIQAAAAAKPNFRSLSLQRYMSSLPQEYNHTPFHPKMSADGVIDNTMVIRREKRVGRTSESFNNSMNSNVKPYFGRETNVRMTSFAEIPDYQKCNSLPCSPKMVAIPAAQLPDACYQSMYRQTVNNGNIYGQNPNQCAVSLSNAKPQHVMNINENPNFLNQTQANESSVNYGFITSGCAPKASHIYQT